MNLISREKIQAFKSFIERHDSFLIAGHKEPDGDCVSSSLGIASILDFFKKEYILLNAGPFKRSEIKKYEKHFTSKVPFMSEHDRSSAALIITDCSEISRLGELDGDLNGLDLFIIDHHKTADSSAENTIIDPTSPAAVCLVQQLYESLCGSPTKEQAENLFFGLATDSGFFRFLGEDSSLVFESASRLIKAGASPRSIYQEVTGGKPWSTRKLLGILLSKAELHADGKLAVTFETLDDTKRFGQEGRDSDALYAALLSTEGVEAVAFIRQDTETTCTLGLRSRESVDVSAVAAKFGGGGHKNASGASCNGRIETLKPLVIKELSKAILN
ncbi:MAG: bifunctional oligoribonuclease/PAP phosphatase NrnA [Treponema sp.]|nr:bifunctional oligoribonuclease/PAP phosphatase NrnA [Treponema sp.]